MKKIILVLVSMVLLFGCSPKQPDENPSVEAPASATPQTPEKSLEDFEGYYELEVECTSFDKYDRVDAKIICPFEATYDDILQHAEAYVKACYDENERVFVCTMEYYDNEVFAKYSEIPVAEANWGPHGSTVEAYFDVEIGDYSTHHMGFAHNPADMRYELTDEDMELYCRMQEAFVQLIGHPATELFSEEELEHGEDEDFAFDDVARKLGVDREVLIDLRIKVSLWRNGLTYKYIS